MDFCGLTVQAHVVWVELRCDRLKGACAHVVLCGFVRCECCGACELLEGWCVIATVSGVWIVNVLW